MNIFNIINSIYKKEIITIDKIDIGLCIALTNILKLNKNNLIYLKKIIGYLFYVEPLRYLMLLFIFIPQNKYPPFIKGIEKIKDKEDLLYNKIAYLYDWGNKELNLQKPILDKVIDRSYWSNQLGVKEKK